MLFRSIVNASSLSQLTISSVSGGKSVPSKNDQKNLKNSPSSAVEQELSHQIPPPMIKIPMSVVAENFFRDKSVLLSSEFTLRKIRPWLKKSDHRKHLKNCEEMLKNGFCLSSLYKCMGSACSYFTNNSELFIKHLFSHIKHQTNDMNNFLMCSYCEFKERNPKELVEHIKLTHGNSR